MKIKNKSRSANPFISAVLAVFLLLSAGFISCEHDPVILEDDPMDQDTTQNPVDTMPDDTIAMPCDSNKVYFVQEVLPLFQSNCAISGCHDAQTAEKGVILDSYENIIETGDVEPFDLGGSKIYRMITESDPDDRMPPPPRNPLPLEDINLIAEWILQGAENTSCDNTGGSCDTTNISFSMDVFPVIESRCLTCHSGPTPPLGINLSTHAGVEAVAMSGQLIGAISHQPGFTNMPQGGTQLDDCTIAKFRNWVEAGAPNN